MWLLLQLTELIKEHISACHTCELVQNKVIFCNTYDFICNILTIFHGLLTASLPHVHLLRFEACLIDHSIF